MRVHHVLRLVGGGALAALTAGGCGSSVNETMGTGGAGATTSTSTSSSTSTGGGSTTTTSTSASTGGTGGVGGGNHSFADAADLPIGSDAVMGTLPDPASSRDYYKFSGTKGEAIGIRIAAQTLMMGASGFDPTIVDPVLFLYDASQKQLAMQDDPWPRSSKDPTLRTILPADGTYYVMVEECNAHTPGGCGDATKIQSFDYSIHIYDLNGSADLQEGGEPDDDAAHATAMVYPKSSGQYVDTFNFGTFASASDVDVFAIKLPADVEVPAGTRPGVRFWLQPSGSSGNGSTSALGKVWVVDPADVSGKHLAELDGALYGSAPTGMNPPAYFRVPVPLGADRYLFVQHPATAAGANDFYFLTSWEHGGNPLEAADTANDLPTSAEALVQQDNKDGTFNYYVDGDIVPAGTDVDHFAFDVPAGVTRTWVYCYAQREGSGLRGLHASLLLPDGTPVPTAAFTEAADHDVHLSGFSLPAGMSKLLLKVEAASQDPNVTGAFYRCTVYLSP